METTRFLRFGEVTLDLEEHAVLREGRTSHLPEEYWNALVRLVERDSKVGAKKVVTKEELYEVLGCSSEGTLTKQIQRIREALGDTARPYRFIKSQRGSGYRWIATVDKAHTIPSRAVSAPAFLEAHDTSSLASEEASRPRQAGLSVPEPQLVRWGPNYDKDKPAGICITSSATPEFIPWAELQLEIEARLLNQLGRHIPANCTVALDDVEGRHNWLVTIIDPDGERLGDIWFGNDPDNHWKYDGLVRVGIALTKYVAEVWQIFQRCSDGSYRRIRAN